MKPSFVTPVLKKVAKKAGVKILVEPKYQYAGQIIFPDGRRHYFKGAFIDLNSVGAAEIARDKAYASFFMKAMGYSTIEGREFFTPRWCKVIKSKNGLLEACKYAKKIGYPVVVKPNDLSQGIGVCKVYSEKELRLAASAIPARCRAFLVQRVVEGSDYRVVVLDGEIISAYRRLPLCVIGDGKSSILFLLKHKQAWFEKSGRDTVINPADPRVASKLKRQKLSLASIPAREEHVVLLDNCNLSTGGDAVDVTAIMHNDYKKLAANIARDMGLRLCGVDIMTEGDIAKPCKDYHVLEVNAAPGLDHYADLGKAQQKVVEDLYLRVLLALKKLR
jgi:D-alanine-D-alanine ligase-like ATP-grasp enzyme